MSWRTQADSVCAIGVPAPRNLGGSEALDARALAGRRPGRKCRSPARAGGVEMKGEPKGAAQLCAGPLPSDQGRAVTRRGRAIDYRPSAQPNSLTRGLVCFATSSGTSPLRRPDDERRTFMQTLASQRASLAERSDDGYGQRPSDGPIAQREREGLNGQPFAMSRSDHASPRRVPLRTSVRRRLRSRSVVFARRRVVMILLVSVSPLEGYSQVAASRFKGAASFVTVARPGPVGVFHASPSSNPPP